MKHTVRLRRGLYVLMDSYQQPTIFSKLRAALPALFCLSTIAFAAITLQIVEQRSSTCPLRTLTYQQ